jgi:hypothetical protein
MGSDRRRRRLHHGPLEDDAGGRVPPQGDEELAQSGREFASSGATARAQDAALQISRIGATVPEHARRRP